MRGSGRQGKRDQRESEPIKVINMTEHKEIIVALIAMLGAVVVALITVGGAVCGYLFQKNKELILKVADQKREAYTGFLKNFTEIAVAVMHDEDVSDKDSDRDRMLARDQLLLYASDDVIKAYDAWVKYSDTEGHDTNKEGELVTLLFLAIRKDILGKTKVTKEHLDNLSPFNRG
jgi:hypothetical protein